MHAEQTTARIIVGAAIIADGRVLGCARAEPPELAGGWEFPGGKVEPGETETAALVRECVEELGVRVAVGDRVGPDVTLPGGRAILRVYAARLLDADPPRLIEHQELRWLSADELFDVAWLPADAPIVAALTPLLARGLAPALSPDPARPDDYGVQLTYPEVGATRHEHLPDGYRHVRRRERLGVGEATLRAAAVALGNWEMQRGAGLVVRASGRAAEGARITSGIGVGPLRIWAPCQVVWLRDEPDRYGYGYGTLPGHPERGEEAFEVRLEPGGEVWFHIRAFSRPARWYARLGARLAYRLQDLVTDRYVKALRDLTARGH